MITIDTIEDLTRRFARERDELANRCEALEDELTRARRSKIRGIKGQAARALDAKAELESAIEASPHLFQKPKTLTIEGIRIGFVKAKGRIEWDSPERVIKLIRTHLPDQAASLISIKESPSRPALAKLSVAELRKVGVSLVESGDVVLIKPQDSAIDKLVDAILETDPEAGEE